MPDDTIELASFPLDMELVVAPLARLHGSFAMIREASVRPARVLNFDQIRLGIVAGHPKWDVLD